MPSPEVILSFREGLKVIQRAQEFATIRQTIDRMVSICPPEDVHMAKDAIARVVRANQAAEMANYQGNPQAIERLDKKYRDLYIVLRTAESKVPPMAQKPQPTNQIAKVRGLGGLNMPMMVIDWLRSKRKYLIAGGAVGCAGGAYLLYKQLTGEKDEKNTDKESSFDNTIKSIQKYKAFTHMMNNPDFSGDYNDIINGTYKKSKPKRKEVKKEEVNKSIEWDREERNLMRGIDNAFNIIGTKPELEYKLPQLPAPKNIDPKELMGEDRPIELSSPPRRKKRVVEKSKKPRKVRKPRKPKPAVEKVEIEEVRYEAEVSPETPNVKKVRRNKTTAESSGRLIPIVKRTKRVKKVKASS